jgi:hypothetical protein
MNIGCPQPLAEEQSYATENNPITHLQPLLVAGNTLLTWLSVRLCGECGVGELQPKCLKLLKVH